MVTILWCLLSTERLTNTGRVRLFLYLTVARRGVLVLSSELFCLCLALVLVSQACIFSGGLVHGLVMVLTKCGKYMRPAPLSYSRVSELVRDLLKGIGLNPNDHGLHSFRSGAATHAANQPNISDRQWGKHGGWVSGSSAQTGYVLDSARNALVVPQALALQFCSGSIDCFLSVFCSVWYCHALGL